MRYLAIACAIAVPAAAIASGPAPDPEAAAQQATPAQSLDQPSYEEPARKWESVEDARPTPENCRDRIRQVREENGLPELDRETADPEKPLMIYAVDRREDGCAVMVVAGDPEDIRPLPKNEKGRLFRRIPAN